MGGRKAAASSNSQSQVCPLRISATETETVRIPQAVSPACKEDLVSGILSTLTKNVTLCDSGSEQRWEACRPAYLCHSHGIMHQVPSSSSYGSAQFGWASSQTAGWELSAD